MRIYNIISVYRKFSYFRFGKLHFLWSSTDSPVYIFKGALDTLKAPLEQNNWFSFQIFEHDFVRGTIQGGPIYLMLKKHVQREISRCNHMLHTINTKYKSCLCSICHTIPDINIVPIVHDSKYKSCLCGIYYILSS